jgi:uncharacterized protein (DUF362 family)
VNSILSDLGVAIARASSVYPSAPPFHPPETYPEYLHRDNNVDPGNGVYPAVRESLRLLGLDNGAFGTPEWNPLGALIRPGDRVLIKPNFVLHFNAGGGPLEAVVTHPAVLRVIVDYILIALEDRGTIVLGDAPQMNCDLSKLFARLGTDVLVSYLEAVSGERGIRFEARDFRKEQTFYKHGIVWERVPLESVKTVPVGLGSESLMDGIDNTRLYGADYRRSETVSAHQRHRHEYVIASDVLLSDVIVSVPKLKVHRKVGTTLNLKNMVGINTDKNHLAHYRVGSPAEGGDEFSDPRWEDRLERTLSDVLLGNNWPIGKYPFLAWRAARKVMSLLRSSSASGFTYGNWHGNDTAWRMALDLNRILLCGAADGTVSPQPIRRYISIIDGIIGGDGEGPLAPDPYPSGCIVGGFNPVAVDWVATRLMGLDPNRIPLYVNAVRQMQEWVPEFAVDKLTVASNAEEFCGVLQDGPPPFQFRAAAGWRGQIERHAVREELDQIPPNPMGAISQ